MLQTSNPEENLSDTVGAATGIGPGASPAQIKQIAELIVKATISEKVQEKLVRRLQKPRMYGLFCVYKTLYLLVHLLPISHDAFREYWIRNCGLFETEYLNDASDPEEVEVCQLIKRLLVKIKGKLKKINKIGCDLQDTMPPEYTTSIGHVNSVSVSTVRSDNAEGSKQQVLPSPSISSSVISKDNNGKNATTVVPPATTSPPEGSSNNPNSETGNKTNYNTPMTPISPNSNPASFIPECFRNSGLPKTAVFSLQTIKPNHTMSQRISTSTIPSHSHFAPSIHQTLDTGLLSPTSMTSLSPQQKSAQIRGSTPGVVSTSRYPVEKVGLAKENQNIEISENQIQDDDDVTSRVSVVLTEYTHQAESSDMNRLYSESVWDLTGCIQKDAIPFAGGGYANIWKGVYTRSIDGRVIKQETVAIKVNHRGTHHTQDETMKKLYQEVHVWKKLRHRNIVPFYGIYTSQYGPGMVSPFYSNGHIIEYLKKTKKNPIKSTNILVHDDGHPCLTDFGLAQIHNDQMIALGHLVFTRETSLPWSPPELLRPASTKVFKTEKSDIYSFACTIVEIMTLKSPYPHITDIPTLIRKICEAEYPDRPEHPWAIPDGLWTLIKRCWNGRAEERPTIHQVIKEFGTNSGL
ncbi:hypothetical protein Clacol_007927 [Clathrus columnatus]|uniref:Protein kinase domain-containing protein n=1 Tax=Clathrus columnatus TaxID=1419009 RepID=A0AAV5AMM0_9AGAM|nr:hypothetical protein Clacol_007927 [Clathrus columnatus]